MSSRMDKYKHEEDIPMRSNKNKALYRQIYNAYDEFENLIVPSNAREINPADLKKEITSREEYRERRDYEDISVKKDTTDKQAIRKEKNVSNEKKETEIYDINELINKAVTENKGPELIEPTLSNGDYLKKLKLDSRKTNIEQVKEIYEDMREEALEEDESLLKTANLSLEILSDLKSDNDATKISAPIKEEELPKEIAEDDFYSSNYKFSKRDFENKSFEEDKDDEEDTDIEESDKDSGKFFFKILLLIFGIALIVFILIHVISFFNRV